MQTTTDLSYVCIVPQTVKLSRGSILVLIVLAFARVVYSHQDFDPLLLVYLFNITFHLVFDAYRAVLLELVSSVW